MTFSWEERAKQKAAARAHDEERLARGEISAADLQRENAHIARHIRSQTDTITIRKPKHVDPEQKWSMTIKLKNRKGQRDTE
ncbi:hypothetical protein [Tropicibacter oceani]|uniref:Uncharacterized protein n=1 Tax=Tropicibacter oceani TaxID=3058420 RepID=A0ABY8QL10_9RHOB|nr:hypothetical protein [Tropicibacter oceani]WGW05324.1 hypothetical protein QF118_07190 [Tropicibacter oceani]